MPSYFCKHVFGKAEYEYETVEHLLLHAAFALCISSFELACTKLIVEIENQKKVEDRDEGSGR